MAHVFSAARDWLIVFDKKKFTIFCFLSFVFALMFFQRSLLHVFVFLKAFFFQNLCSLFLVHCYLFTIIKGVFSREKQFLLDVHKSKFFCTFSTFNALFNFYSISVREEKYIIPKIYIIHGQSYPKTLFTSKKYNLLWILCYQTNEKDNNHNKIHVLYFIMEFHICKQYPRIFLRMIHTNLSSM